ncbi:MAG: alpha-ketoglutarate-dependent dioxygenase AlkB [Pseudomonadales bacterium]|nr:alpha-ketoglutarate-dependent dioxygenase AlkB [Pseudomonadales bacterium]
MSMEAVIEANILKNRNVLLVLSSVLDESFTDEFCGTTIFFDENSPQPLPDFDNKTVYLCGDISIAVTLDLNIADRVFIVGELSQGYINEDVSWPIVSLGQVPVLIQNVGVYYRRYFDPKLDLFNRVSEEHVFQALTESNKPSKAYRTGIYLTPVERDKEGLHFRLLRCSTNLAGPSETFRATDRHIVDALNQEAAYVFENQAPLNHVLAQIYRNIPATDERKQAKAKIGSHADKTKDMPSNGVMAFCTFYDELEKLQPLPGDPFDYGYKVTSGLTKLRFRLKDPGKQTAESKLPEEFTITLYPDSAFFMPLSTNRLYTHEIKPSTLDADKIPTRLGYVVRCSNTEALHKEGHTFLKQDGKLVELEQATPEGVAELRKLYAKENKTEEFIDYGGKFLFSMNGGDYLVPDYNHQDEFRCYNLSTKQNLYGELYTSVLFENAGKGRLGTVLVDNDTTCGTPIVRTTTKYQSPAHRFSKVHAQLAQAIGKSASLPVAFNNALIEHYVDRYASMGMHSDQAQDLHGSSFIALFSCYKYPEIKNSRKLIVVSKDGGDGTFEIPMKHNSVIIFSVNSNRRFKHKIVLDASGQERENPWLGITFRTSKTFIKYDNGNACLEDGSTLKIANEEESRGFYSLRRRENSETDFHYPHVTYTLSESDLVSPV